MFRNVALSIIRSFSLYTAMAYAIQIFWQLASRIRTELVPSWSCSIPLLCVHWKTPDDGQRNCPTHTEFYSKNKFEKLVHLVGFVIRIHFTYLDNKKTYWIFTTCCTISVSFSTKCRLFHDFIFFSSNNAFSTSHALKYLIATLFKQAQYDKIHITKQGQYPKAWVSNPQPHLSIIHIVQTPHNKYGHILLFFDVRPVNQSTKTDVASCHKKVGDQNSKAVFLNRRAAARYRALASIISGSKRFSWNW